MGVNQALQGDHVMARPADFDAGSARDYIALMKPRVMSLVIFTAGIGMVMAPGVMHPVFAAAALIMIALGAGASAALNMWYDADIDQKMMRTAQRPVPAGVVSATSALSFGLWMSGVSVLCLAVMVNYLSAALLAFTIIFYAVFYTMWLKRRTPQNIVIGGAAGALPPVIGWAAVANSVSLEPLLYFLIIFMWTPPHFWALALIKKDEYASVGVPMLPVTHGVRATCWHIVVYSGVMVFTALTPALWGTSGSIYLVGTALLSLVFFGLSLWVFSAPTKRAAGWMFAYSIFYLFAVFALLPADRWLGGL